MAATIDNNMEGYELFRKSVSNMPMIFYLLDKNWIFKLSDGKGLEKLGLKPGQVVGLSAREMYKDHPDIIEAIERAFSGESVFMEHALGDYYLENYVVPYCDQTGKIEGVIGATIDITERKKIANELNETHNLQKAFMDSVPGMLYMYNSEFRMSFWNEAHKTITGFTDEELQGKGLFDWFKDDLVSQKAIIDGLTNMADTGFGEAEVNLQLKDNTALPMYFTACPLTIEGEKYFVGVGVDISSRKKVEAELIELNKTLEDKVNQRTQELMRSNEELSNANEELNAMNEEMQAINMELADSYKKLREMQAQLVESEKMAALGNLVAGVAHEVNTPIGVSVTAASHLSDIAQELLGFLRNGELKEENIVPVLQDIEKATRIILRNLSHAGQLVQSFKQLSVDQSSEPQREFDAGDYLEEILISLSPIFKKTNIKIQTHTTEKILINGWPGAYTQIITNLLMNASQHAYLPGETGQIDITLSSKRDKVLLIFQDDGHGMAKDILEKIFEPFFTTKRYSGGTGLGLSIVFTLVTQTFHGSIHCESAPEHGAKFFIELSQGRNPNE